VTCVGTPAEADELDRFTGCPPAGAGFIKVTVPPTVLPPMTCDLESDIDPTQSADAAAGFTVSVADAELAEAAVIVAVVADETVEVVTGKLAVVCPDGMVTDPGTVAAALLLDNPTCTPPEGAADDNVTVPVAPWPAVTDDGETEKLAIVPWLLPVEAGLTESVATAVLAEEALIVAVVGDETGDVETGNVAVV
jgi:hypothetical protein